MSEGTEQQTGTAVAGRDYGALLDCDPAEQYKLLKSQLGDTSQWTAGDNATYYAFFLHGWLGRSGDAEYQDRGENPNTVLYQSAVSGLWYVSEKSAGDVAAVKVNGKIYKAI